MATENNKKLLIVYILKVLEEYSDENNPLSQSDIVKKIEDIYGMTSERKAISRNIDSLIDLGYDIIKNPGGGVYIIKDIETSELTFLIDSIFSSPSVSPKLAKQLMAKLLDFATISEKNTFKYIVKAEDIIRTDNKQVFYTIGIINDAIKNNKKISFFYNRKDINNKLVKRKEKKYIVSPYFLMNSRGKYYLVCNYEPYETLSNYRIDMITDIGILKEDSLNVNNFSKYKNGIDKSAYANEHIYMFSGDTVSVKFKISCEDVISDMIDWFGTNIREVTVGGGKYIEVKANENAIFYWTLQYGEKVELVEPKDLRERIKSAIKFMLMKYEDK